MSSHTTSGKSSTKTSYKSSTTNQSRKPSSTLDLGSLRIRMSDVGLGKKNPEQEDLKIQQERVAYILKIAIQKLKLAISLRQLLRNDAQLLHQFMSTSDIIVIQNACARYTKPVAAVISQPSEMAVSSTINKAMFSRSRLKSKSSLIKYSGKVHYSIEDNENMFNEDIIHILDLLWKSKPLRQKVLADLTVTDNPKCFCFNFINAIESLINFANHRLSLSAREEKECNRQLRSAWGANTSLQEGIDKAVEEIQIQRDNLGKEVENRKITLADYKKRVDELNFSVRAEIMNKIVDSERGMAMSRQESALIQPDLSYEAKESTRAYDALILKHLRHESNLRKKRLKVETQLASWLTKFDADVGERQDNMDNLTKMFNEGMEDFKELQKVFDEQEVDYVVFMAEKEEEEAAIFGAKLYAFVCNRSVRRIQRYWRAYRQRKIDKKKNKGKPKKEEEIDDDDLDLEI